MWGCHSPTIVPQIELDGEKHYRCPQRFVYENHVWCAELFEIWRWYKEGFLPDPGTWIDQSLAFIGLMRVLDAAVAEGDRTMRDQERHVMKTRATAGPKLSH